MSSKLTALGTGQGYLKGGFLGFQAAGKTFTAMLLAVGTRAQFRLDGPIVMIDSEGGSEYIAPHVRALTGKDLIGLRTRAFDDLIEAGQEALAIPASVLIADSVTHFWRELCDAYLASVNAQRKKRNQPPRHRLEFQDWAPLKARWGVWSDWYLNAPIHAIVCGRAGYEYDFRGNEETGRDELVKTGIRMKAEGEFGYEPSLLVEMERQQIPDPERPGHFQLRRQATVLKDRFGAIDGHSTLFGQREVPKALEETFGFFFPHVERLTPGAHAPVDTAIKSDLGVDDSGDDAWTRERRQRQILSEEIQSELVLAYPGLDQESKRAKLELIKGLFNTGSWTAVEGMPSERLRAGLERLRGELEARGKRAETPAASVAEPPLAADPGPPVPWAPEDGSITEALVRQWEEGLVSAPTTDALTERSLAISATKAYKAMTPMSKKQLKAVVDHRRAEMTQGALV